MSCQVTFIISPSYAQVCPSIDDMERAFDDSRRCWYSERPFVSPIVPGYIDETLAPGWKHVVLLSGGHAPYELKGRDRTRERDNVVKNAIAVMDEFAPGFSDSVLGYSLYLPTDLEEVLGIPRGHELHADVSLDQFFSSGQHHIMPISAARFAGSINAVPPRTREVRSPPFPATMPRWRYLGTTSG